MSSSNARFIEVCIFWLKSDEKDISIRIPDSDVQTFGEWKGKFEAAKNFIAKQRYRTGGLACAYLMVEGLPSPLMFQTFTTS